MKISSRTTVLVRQSAAGVLPAPHGDFERARVVARNPDVSPFGRRAAGPDRHFASGKLDSGPARAPIAPLEKPCQFVGFEARALNAAVDHDLWRIDGTETERARVRIMARRILGLGEHVLPAQAVPIADRKSEGENVGAVASAATLAAAGGQSEQP